jgi:hypothetical protein
LVIDRSADAPTAVVADAESLEGSGSGDCADTTAVFVSDAA